jgi:biopolymer transport protein TolQ
MTSDLSVIGLLLQASIPVKIVMILLILASLVSWTIIFTKRRLIRRTRAASDDFEASFWSGGDLNTLYQSAARGKGGAIGMASIFEGGFREYSKGASGNSTAACRAARLIRTSLSRNAAARCTCRRCGR